MKIKNLTTQREKFENLFYELKWSREALTTAIDERANTLVMSRYSRSLRVTHKDILVGSIGKRKGTGPSALGYMIDRTLMRPRDLIAFFNTCIKDAGEVPMITADTIRRAEREYSRSRLSALEWEWKMHLPNLIAAAQALLAGRVPFFKVVELHEELCIEVAEKILSESAHDALSEAAKQYDGSGETIAFKRRLLRILYEVGLVGLKLAKSIPTEFVMNGAARVSEHEISEDTRVDVHKCFWRSLGIREVEA